MTTALCLTRTRSTPDRTRWWRDARFGMFIHWGVYAVPARGEWVMHAENITMREYAKLAAVFNPTKYDPRAWARLARRAGMRYMVLTAKHHDGFCLFDTKYTGFNAVKSMARRDLLREYAQACRAEGLGIGFYFSIMDWRHPNCPLAWNHPLRLLEPKARHPDPATFMAFVKGQLTELLTNYGKLDILWFDGRIESLCNFGPPLAAYLRSLQPDILINNRLGQAEDFQTPEQDIPLQPLVKDGRPLAWETCDTLTGAAWGYNRYDHNFRPAAHQIRRLITAASSGGNYLLNVGPRADGTIQPEAVARLRAIGRWMQRYGEAIYATEEGPICHPPYGRMTRRGNRVFLHVFDWPANGRLALPQLTGRLLSARLMNGPALSISRQCLCVPRRAPDATASVVVLDYAGTPACALPRAKSKAIKQVTPPVGYHVRHGRPVAINGSLDKSAWDKIRAIRFTPEGHFDYAAERYSGVKRDNLFACTLRAMHAGEVLYLALEVETDRLYMRPRLDLAQNDAGRFLFAAGRRIAHLNNTPEAFEITVDAAGRTWMPNEDRHPCNVFRHAVMPTPRGYTIMLAVPFSMMLKNRLDRASHLRVGDTFRFNLLAVQSAPPIVISPAYASRKKPEWWERPPDPWNIFVGCRHWMFWKGKAGEDPFYNVSTWDVWKLEK